MFIKELLVFNKLIFIHCIFKLTSVALVNSCQGYVCTCFGALTQKHTPHTVLKVTHRYISQRDKHRLHSPEKSVQTNHIPVMQESGHHTEMCCSHCGKPSQIFSLLLLIE